MFYCSGQKNKWKKNWAQWLKMFLLFKSNKSFFFFFCGSTVLQVCDIFNTCSLSLLVLLRSVCAVSEQQQLSVGLSWDAFRPRTDCGPCQHREASSWHPCPWGGTVLHSAQPSGHKNSYCIRESTDFRKLSKVVVKGHSFSCVFCCISY